MRKLISVLLVLLSFFVGFVFAGIQGAGIFGALNTLAWIVFKNRSVKKIVVKIVLSFLMLSLCGYLMMILSGLVGANAVVHEKVSDIRNELVKEGYKPKWVIISQKRFGFYNNILRNSVKNGKSKHLGGKAIDLFILDIDGNGKYDRNDFDLLKNASLKCEKIKPGTRGKIYHYFGKGRLTQYMVHVEVE